MTEIPRVEVEEARRKSRAGEALLVCAYADAAKCNAVKLEGSITLADLQSRIASVPRDREIILYCA